MTRKLGSYDVFPIALGCMGMSGMYGAADERESIATIHEAIDRGVTLLDTGDFYGMATTSYSSAAPFAIGATACCSP